MPQVFALAFDLAIKERDAPVPPEKMRSAIVKSIKVDAKALSVERTGWGSTSPEIAARSSPAATAASPIARLAEIVVRETPVTTQATFVLIGLGLAGLGFSRR